MEILWDSKAAASKCLLWGMRASIMPRHLVEGQQMKIVGTVVWLM